MLSDQINQMIDCFISKNAPLGSDSHLDPGDHSILSQTGKNADKPVFHMEQNRFLHKRNSMLFCRTRQLLHTVKFKSACTVPLNVLYCPADAD